MNVLLQKYRILGKKGEGTFSEVLKVQNIKDGSYKACKKMKQTYDSMEQVNNLREVQAMRRLAPHANILELMEVIFDQKSGMLVLICELMDMNIYEMIRVTLGSMEDVLKLADFGSCRSLYSKQPYTEYISTRWYRAPECLLTDGHYTYKMDIWSIGCVFFEILSLRPLFPGSNEVDQIAKIHDIMGTPDPSVLNKLKRSRGINFNFPTKKGSGIERLLPHASKEAIQVIYQLCTYDPDERLTARQALKHSYFKDLRDADKRAAALAKRQLQENKKANELPPPTAEISTIGGDQDSNKPVPTDAADAHDKTIPEELRPPVKKPQAEVTVYPVKAQSLPTQAQTLKEKNKRVGAGEPVTLSLPNVEGAFSSSEVEENANLVTGNKKKKRRHRQRQSETGFSHHSGALPRVTMHTSTFNPSAFAKVKADDTSTTTTMLPSITNAFKPHKGAMRQEGLGVKQYAPSTNPFKPYQATAPKPAKSFLSNYTLPSLDRRY